MLNKEQILQTAEAFALKHSGIVILVYGAAEVIYGAKAETNDLDIYLVSEVPFDTTGWEWLEGSVNPVIWKQGIYDLALLSAERLCDTRLVSLSPSVYIYDLATTIALRAELVNKLGRPKDYAALEALKAVSDY